MIAIKFTVDLSTTSRSEVSMAVITSLVICTVCMCSTHFEEDQIKHRRFHESKYWGIIENCTVSPLSTAIRHMGLCFTHFNSQPDLMRHVEHEPVP